MILTDCSAFQFFEMYDRFGPGFAARRQLGQSANARVRAFGGGLHQPHSLCARPRTRWRGVREPLAGGTTVVWRYLPSSRRPRA